MAIRQRFHAVTFTFDHMYREKSDISSVHFRSRLYSICCTVCAMGMRIRNGGMMECGAILSADLQAKCFRTHMPVKFDAMVYAAKLTN